MAAACNERLRHSLAPGTRRPTWPPDLSAIKALDRSQQSTERERGTAALLRSAGQALPLLRSHGVRARTLPLLARALAASVPGRDPEQRALVLRHAKLELGADTFAELYRRFRPSFSSFHLAP